jgi:hypothetical protein
LGSLAEAGLLTFEEYNNASVALFSMEFIATSFDSSSMLSAVQLSSWSIEKEPASQFVEMFSNPRIDAQSLLRILAEFVLRLYREPLLAETRCTIVKAFLEAFSKRSGAIPLLQSLRSQTSHLFGLNGVGKEQFGKCFDRWMEHRERPLIVLP